MYTIIYLLATKNRFSPAPDPMLHSRVNHRLSPSLSLFLSILLVSALLITGSCTRSVRAPAKSRVILTYQKIAYRCAILLKELDLVVKIQPRGALPYSANASAAIWIGKDFPFDKAIQVIEISQRYYDDLRYVALSDYRQNPPDSVHEEIFIGGSTESALRLGLRAWTPEDFNSLKQISSAEQLNEFIKARYGQPRTIPEDELN